MKNMFENHQPFSVGCLLRMYFIYSIKQSGRYMGTIHVNVNPLCMDLVMGWVWNWSNIHFHLRWDTKTINHSKFPLFYFFSLLRYLFCPTNQSYFKLLMICERYIRLYIHLVLSDAINHDNNNSKYTH